MKRLRGQYVAGMFRRLGLIVIAVALSACGSMGSHPPAPAKVETTAPKYLIGPLDALNVVVWRNPELSTVVTVRPDGMISTPLVEDLRAAGKTPSELAREMEKSLSRVIRDPVVSVVVTGFQGVYSEQIRIVGEASRPQSVPYRKDMTLLDVMIQVGGLTDFADGNAAVLIRGSEGGKQYSVRLKDLLRRGDISANAPVLPGDVIIVPQGWF
ncbi:MAG: XrtA/PEP-CTERM system exopolysaccharide export protein [Gammaproteobacteria bacterium]